MYSSIVTNATNGNFTTQKDDDPSNASDWAALAAMFGYYRCCVCGMLRAASRKPDTQTHSSTPDRQLENQSTKYHKQQQPV
jgi:hypothetical protein